MVSTEPLTETLEGIIGGTVRFHLDVVSDVLYLKLVEEEQTPSLGDPTDDGDILLIAEDDDRPIGLTVISWWKRFGTGPLPDSIAQIELQIAPLAERVMAAVPT